VTIHAVVDFRHAMTLTDVARMMGLGGAPGSAPGASGTTPQNGQQLPPGGAQPVYGINGQQLDPTMQQIATSPGRQHRILEVE